MNRLTNPRASREAVALMAYLESIEGKQVLSAQHTKTPEPPELRDLQVLTGKLPAICGFELLGYSPNVNYTDTDEDAITEIMENRNTMDTAVAWALEKKGIVTYTWHWYSPMRGHNKSFYTQYTDFNLEVTMRGNCPEYTAILRDMDLMADYLKRFRDLKIPILWRPLHEAEGGWFWWGAKGAEPCKALWRLMYDRYVNVHHLDNLIWVWNSTNPDWYPGDDCVDIISRDLYVPDDNPLKAQYDELRALTPGKLMALAECGMHPDVGKMNEAGSMWLWSMAWCFGDLLTMTEAPARFHFPDWQARQQQMRARQKAFYNHELVVSLDGLPWNS